jgi:L-alanine-DL-glutamate epimerase-like enolase superfamily enzyme
MRITGIECHVLAQPAWDTSAASWPRDDILVEIHTDAGITGVGESDVNPWIARACIEDPGPDNVGPGLGEILIGSNPMDVEGLWERLYIAAAMNGCRGAVMNVLGAVDIALHDLRGKALGKPCHALLGNVVRDHVVPYASLRSLASSADEHGESMVDSARRAVAAGFRAVKVKVALGGAWHNELPERWERSTEVLGATRAAIGPGVDLLVACQYAFPDADAALGVLERWRGLDVVFVETPLWPDDLDGYRRLSSEQPIPIAAGQCLTTRLEYLDLMDRGRVQVVQVDIGRVGGLTEARRFCQLAAQRGRRIVPRLWNSGISTAAAVHLATVTPGCDYVEFLPAKLSEPGLSQDLTRHELEMVDGVIPLPRAPGLGLDSTARRSSGTQPSHPPTEGQSALW